VLGAAFLWFGWFGFNAGSALTSGGLATSAFVVTNTAAAMAALALWAGDKPPERRPLQPLGVASISLGALAASVFLTWEQAAKVKAFCFWCLLSAGINAAILPLALSDGLKALRVVQRGRRLNRLL